MDHSIESQMAFHRASNGKFHRALNGTFHRVFDEASIEHSIRYYVDGTDPKFKMPTLFDRRALLGGSHSMLLGSTPNRSVFFGSQDGCELGFGIG